MSPKRPKILLINPPIYDFALYDLYLKPYGLYKMEEVFRKSGYETILIDAMDISSQVMFERYGRVKRRRDGSGKFYRAPIPFPLKEITDRSYGRYGLDRDLLTRAIKESKADLIGITSGMTYWYQGIQEVVEICRKHQKGRPVFVGGTSASLIPGLLKELSGADEVLGSTDCTLLSEHLESHGFPPLTSLPEEHYDTSLLQGQSSAVIRLNTGCPYRCRYCASALIEPEFRSGEGQKRAEFALKIHKDTGIRHFAFYDDALLYKKEEVFFPFMETIIASGKELNFYLPNAVHIRYLDEKTLSMMHRSGFREIRMGFEAADSDFHTKMGNKNALENFKEVITRIRNLGFEAQKSAVYILAGLPGQLAEEVEQSIRYAGEAGARCRIASFSPVPHSALWEESLKACPYPLETEPLFHNNTLFPMEHDGFTKGDLQRLKELCSLTPFQN